MIMENTQQDIENFLPKYPLVEQVSQESILNPYDDNFYHTIYRKKEFYDERLDETEDIPTVPGEQLKYQKFIARFLSSQTPYDQVLLFHEMGTGKTCSAIGIIEKIRKENSNFTGSMIFAKGEGLINNFKNELAFKCTDGCYIPENYNELTEGEKVARLNKKIGEYYSFYKTETFAKGLKKMSNILITDTFSNKIIVIDEIHNIRIQDKQDGIGIYEQFHRFLHAVKNCKIILLSGTPMKDGPEEIATVMNLILPMEKQIPIQQDFLDEFLINSKQLNPEKIQILKNFFRGRISYLKSMKSKIERVFEGENLELSHFKVVPDYMSDFQSTSYLEAYGKDIEDKGIYNNSRQASLFVFPDGTYGENGFSNEKFIHKKIKNVGLLTGKKKETTVFSLGIQLRNALFDSNEEEMLNKIFTYSSKYSSTIRSIVDAYKNGKSSFVYCEFVMGSGSILFSLLLELFGFSKGRGDETTKGKRYALITNVTASQKGIKNIINRFNQPDNINGEFISVIIGSRVISEGFSLKHIQLENVLTPHWNYSETSQALARGYRLGSHKDLINAGIVPVLKIAQRVSMPNRWGNVSIDLQMYKISEEKDIVIKGIERAIKEVAVDCALNYKRNLETGLDGKRECEYTDCNYTCDFQLSEELESKDIDKITYQLYYAETDEINPLVINFFNIKFSATLEEILNYLSEYSEFEILTSLRYIIVNNVEIINKYGFVSFLREYNNYYYLVDSIDTMNDYYSGYYVENPSNKIDIKFKKLVRDLHYKNIPLQIQKMFDSTDEKEIGSILSTFSTEVKAVILESCILSLEKRVNINVIARDIILEYFKKFYKQNSSLVWIHYLLSEESDITRCMKNFEWINCNEEELTTNIEEQNPKDTERYENNPYGYYGIYNTSDNKFSIRDVSDDIANKDKRKIPTGKQCTTWNKEELTKIVSDVLKLDFPPNFYIEKTKDELWDMVLKNKIAKTFYNQAMRERDDLTKDDLRRSLYFSVKPIKNTCGELKQWFEDNNLLQVKL